MASPKNPSGPVTAQPVSAPGAESILTPTALAFVADLQPRFGRPPRRAARPRRRPAAPRSPRTGRLDFLAGDRRRPRGRLAGGPGPGRPGRPPGRDHRPDRAARWRSTRSTPAPRSGSPTSRTPTPRTGATSSAARSTCYDAVRRDHRLHRPGRARSTGCATDGELPTIVLRPRGWHLDERHLHGRRPAGRRRRSSTSGSTSSTTPPSCSTAAAARTSTCRRWRATSRRGCGTTCSTTPSRRSGIPHGTIRATVLIETIPAAFEMEEILYELREHAAGLNAGRWDYLFSIIKNFRDARRRVRAARPRRGDDDRAVHARLHRAAGQHLPPARRVRDRRHGRVHPQPPRRGGQRGARSPRCARTRTARPATASTAPGWPTPTWCRSAAEVFDRRARRPAQPARPAARRRARHAADSCSTSPRPRRAAPRPGCAATSSVALRYLGRVAGRQRRGRHPQPDGGRRDRRDLPLADLAVGAQRRDASTTAQRVDRGAGPAGRRRGAGRRIRDELGDLGRRTSRRPASSSSRSRSTTTSPTS